MEDLIYPDGEEQHKLEMRAMNEIAIAICRLHNSSARDRVLNWSKEKFHSVKGINVTTGISIPAIVQKEARQDTTNE